MSSAQEKYKLFAEHYKKNGNSEKAALHAGYSAKHAQSAGSRLLKHPTVMALMSDKTDPIINGAIVVSIKPLITSDWISEQLQNIVMQDDTPPAAKVSALGQLAKMFGHDTAKNFIKFEGIANTHGERAKAIADSVATGKLDTETANHVLSVIKQSQGIEEVATFGDRIKALEVINGIK